MGSGNGRHPERQSVTGYSANSANSANSDNKTKRDVKTFVSLCDFDGILFCFEMEKKVRKTNMVDTRRWVG